MCLGPVPCWCSDFLIVRNGVLLYGSLYEGRCKATWSREFELPCVHGLENAFPNVNRQTSDLKSKTQTPNPKLQASNCTT